MDFPSDLLDRLGLARRITVLTGAGVSAESGVPTFRDAQRGLWSQFSPEELATPEAFLQHPRRVWEWYAWRRECLSGVEPNPAHHALAAWEKRVPAFTLITQNVDGLHQRAGSECVIEVHGNLQRTKCFEENRVVAEWPETGDVPPRCPHCAGMLRPDVVWFGEPLPAEAVALAQERSASCDVFLSIGTSGLVYPAASLPYQAQASGALLVEINRDPTPLTTAADHVLSGRAGEVLPELLKRLT